MLTADERRHLEFDWYLRSSASIRGFLLSLCTLSSWLHMSGDFGRTTLAVVLGCYPAQLVPDGVTFKEDIRTERTF